MKVAKQNIGNAGEYFMAYLLSAKLPSNLQGLYKCEYEGEELPFSLFGKLSKALKGFRN